MGKSSSGDVRSLMEMSDRERDGFLREQGVGVLSLARDRRSYAFPVSYGYDASESLVAVMLGYAPDSEKRGWVEETEVATLVAHEMCDDGEAASVVVRGALVEADDDEVGDCYEAMSENAEFTVGHESGARLEDTEYVVHRFEIESAVGRRYEYDAALPKVSAHTPEHPRATQD